MDGDTQASNCPKHEWIFLTLGMTEDYFVRAYFKCAHCGLVTVKQIESTFIRHEHPIEGSE